MNVVVNNQERQRIVRAGPCQHESCIMRLYEEGEFFTILGPTHNIGTTWDGVPIVYWHIRFGDGDEDDYWTCRPCGRELGALLTPVIQGF